MFRIRRHWAILAVAYGLFLLWHTPWQDPLTEAELESYAEAALAAEAQNGAEPAAFAAFFLSDDGRPFYMVNLITFRQEAVYEEGFPDSVTSAEEANQIYAQTVLRLLLARGSYPVVLLDPKVALLNSYRDVIGTVDTVAVVRYRSRRDFLDMVSSDSFRAIEVHKWASVEQTLVMPSHAPVLMTLNALVPGLLIALGALTSALRSRRARDEVQG